MSQPTEREDRLAFDTDALLDRAREWYHVPLLALLFVFMLWNRVRTWENYTRGGDILFSGNDAWYHFRQTSFTVSNWPFTMNFDPWTFFPYGTAPGQFGTLFDQLIATVALVLGLVMPQEQATAFALLFAPAVFGTLVAVPAYFLAKRFGGRAGGVVAVTVLALTPGAFLFRGLVGWSDHHIAEVFFQVLAMLGVMVAVTAAEREKPVFEQLSSREFSTLRRPLGFAALAGVAIALYIWVWPPGIFVVSVLGLFFLAHLIVTFLKGHSPEHVAIVGVVMFLVAGVFSAVRITKFEFTATDFSLLQPTLFVLLAGGLAVMAALARRVEGRDDATTVYVGGILGAIALGTLLFAVVLPDTFSFFVDQSLRIYGLDANAKVRTVNEAQPIPLGRASSYFFGSYGLAFFAAVVGGLVLLGRYLLDDDPRGEALLLVLWGAMMVLATLTQNRFGYYLAVPVGALTAYVVAQVVALADLDTVGSLSDLDASQVMTIAVIVLIVFAPFVAVTGPLFPQSGGVEPGAISLQSVERAENNGPGEVTAWQGSLQWLSENTPKEGQYANPDGEAMPYYENFGQTDDYDYPEGAYGVMAWWDYGHFITVEGQRIPDANPFQQGATRAANFLLGQNESQANEYMTVDNGSSRYVMVDWKLADPRSGKYTAPASFDTIGVSSADLLSARIYTQRSTTEAPRTAQLVRSQDHYESMRVRLYRFHGSAAGPTLPNGKVLVVDWETRQFTVGSQTTQPLAAVPSDGQVYKTFDSLAAAEEYVQNDSTSQIGGLPGIPAEQVEALEHYRLVHASDATAGGVGQWVKTFERVDGATVEGTGPANTTVTARVQLRIPGPGQNFTYVQQAQTDAQGQFTMTLPYSTTGYDEWGTEEGYTNVSVRAAGPYEFRAATQSENLTTTVYNATADVNEANVVGEREGPIEVTLEQSEVIEPDGANASNGTNGTDAPADPGNTTESPDAAENGSDAGGNASNGSTGGNGSNESGNASEANASALVGPVTQSTLRAGAA
ncbi:oligosaccharyl transferase, archaeosortase A system-associated [Halomarina litorea]|uniref:oligosaccharyl transferase, archaeosortase A system-associated n=1 Tax=Halomarina litorea TaxID=2961595 RepID=UPI0020C51EF0|nr:oligosaccharyl transferase, archaeosortase A system-associated [Halomarina sp. BCD28]